MAKLLAALILLGLIPLVTTDTATIYCTGCGDKLCVLQKKSRCKVFDKSQTAYDPLTMDEAVVCRIETLWCVFLHGLGVGKRGKQKRSVVWNSGGIEDNWARQNVCVVNYNRFQDDYKRWTAMCKAKGCTYPQPSPAMDTRHFMVFYDQHPRGEPMLYPGVMQGPDKSLKFVNDEAVAAKMLCQSLPRPGFSFEDVYPLGTVPPMLTTRKKKNAKQARRVRGRI